MKPIVSRASTVAALLVLTLGVLAVGSDAAAITLDFVVWNYSIETIKDNIQKFEAMHPNVKVNLREYPWTEYHDTMVLRLRGGTPTAVLYVGEDWLPEWAAAGWLAPIEEHFPEIRAKYANKMTRYALRDLSYKGKMYGLPYYADLFTFYYNAQILKKHNLAVPKNWDEVLDASLKLKRAGLEKPFAYMLNPEIPNFYQEFVSQVYGRGGLMFDDKLQPLFNDPGSEAFKHLQWLQDANKKHGILHFEKRDPDIVIALNTGKHVFSVTWNYLLARANDKASQPLAGQFRIAPMPGPRQAPLGFSKFYAMTKQCADNAECRKAAWTFIEYMGGGDFRVAKRWAVEKGLGFAQLPLFDDPDVKKAWSLWIDMEDFKQQAQVALNGTQSEWIGIWSAFFRPLLAKAINGDITVKEAMDAGAAKWNEYRTLMGR